MTKHNTPKRQISMPPEGFEPAIPTSGRLQVHASGRAATGTGLSEFTTWNIEYGFVVD